MSHPTWVRGLKLGNSFNRLCVLVSHPTWVRGLKPHIATPVCVPVSSRTLRGCVD